MPLPPDRVQVLKQESASQGGSAADDQYFDQPIEPQEDALESAGLYLQDGSNRDETTLLWREGDDAMFKDVNNPQGYTLTELAEQGQGAGVGVGFLLILTTGGVIYDSDGSILVKEDH